MAGEIILPYKVEGLDELKDTKKVLESLNKENNLTQKEVDETNKKFDDQEKQTNKTKGALTGLGDQLKSTANRVQVMGVGLGDLATNTGSATRAIGGATKALKILKVAIAATGIGALIIALGTLISFFTNTQRGADKLNIAFKTVGATVDVLIDRVSQFGEGLFQIISGDFSAGLDNLADSFSGVVDEIRNEASAAADLEERRQALERREIELIRLQGERRDQLSELILLSRDESISAAERTRIIQEAQKIQNQINVDAIELEKERVDILRESQALGENLIEDDRELAEAERVLTETRKTGNDQLRELVNRERELGAARKQEIADLEALREAELVNFEVKSEILEMEVEAVNAAEQAKSDKRLEIQAKEVAAEIAKDQNELKRKKQSEAIRLKDTQEFEQAKREAIGKTAQFLASTSFEGAIAVWFLSLNESIINTALGVTKALSQANVPLAVAIGIAGAAETAAIASNRPKRPKKFKEGGPIHGLSHDQGGTMIEAEHGEYVLRKKAVDHYGLPLIDSLNRMQLQVPNVVNDNSELVKAWKSRPENHIIIDEKGFTLRQIKKSNIMQKKASRYAI